MNNHGAPERRSVLKMCVLRIEKIMWMIFVERWRSVKNARSLFTTTPIFLLCRVCLINNSFVFILSEFEKHKRPRVKKIEPRIRQKKIPSWKIKEEDLKESHFPDSNLRHKKQAAAVPEPLYRLDQEYDLSLDRIHRIKKFKEKTHRSTLATNLRDWRRRSDCRGNKKNFIKVCTFSLVCILTKTPGRCIWKLQGGGLTRQSRRRIQHV